MALLPGGLARVDALFAYAGAVFGAPARAVYEEIEAGATPDGRLVVQSWQDVLRSEGRREGRDEGVLVGEILTWARVRFGPLAEDVVARVRAGAGDDLQRWPAAVESAESLDALFGPAQ